MKKPSVTTLIWDLLFFSVVFAAAFMELPYPRAWFPQSFLPVALSLLLLTAIRVRPNNLPFPCVLYAGYALWTALTRLYLHGWVPFLDEDQGFLTTVMTALVSLCMLLAGTTFPKQTRRIFLSLLAFAFCSLTALVSVLEIYGSITPRPVAVHTTDVVTFAVEESVAYAQLFWSHRNAVAAWLMAAFFLAIYLFFSCRKKLFRIPFGMEAAIIFCGISLQFCRSVMVAMSVGIGMLIMLLILEHMSPSYGWKRIVCMLAAGALAAGICYKTSDFCANGSKILRDKVVKPEITTYEQAQEAAQDQAQDPKIPLMQSASGTTIGEDNRDFLHDLTTLTLRTGVWSATWKAATHSAQTFLLGNQESAMSQNLVNLANFDRFISHGHNFVMHTLYVCGLPGVLLLAAFVLGLLIVMLRVFWTSKAAIPLSLKCLILPLAALLIYGIMEPLFSYHTAIATNCFCLIAGVFLAESKELLSNPNASK